MSNTLYFKKNKVAYAINLKKYPKLFSYLSSKKVSDAVREEYLKWKNDSINFDFPRRVLEEQAMDSLMNEIGIKDRWVDIYMNGVSEDDKICTVMGVGRYNEIIFEMYEPNMDAIMKIAYEHAKEKGVSPESLAQPAPYVPEFIKKRHNPQ